jgi:hypothetical protein
MQQQETKKISEGNSVNLGLLRPIVAQQTGRYDGKKKCVCLIVLTFQELNSLNF